MINSITTPPVGTLGAGGQVQAPKENIAQFQALMQNMKTSLESAKSSLKEVNSTARELTKNGDLLQNTAMRVSESEQTTSAIQRDIAIRMHELKGGLSLDNHGFTRSVVQLNFMTAGLAVMLGGIQTTTTDLTEEISSVTKGRSA
ncbi:MAG TPA: hypothetical protein VFX23_14975 [Limnobacter sp.]|uniref:hypothetical protein n=1 Tax=Limnobacter sp. TaxID=2003368 RepID=UPI002E36B734|nr:hypothetical protein [Limnobacter sp.]HEX5487288.1 hypothetical protein [Limnobacter sp.]